jgi:RIO-like serine/threonine protein kinase
MQKVSDDELKVLKVIERELAVTHNDLVLKAADIPPEDLNNILRKLSEGKLTKIMDLKPGDRVYLITEAGAKTASTA